MFNARNPLSGSTMRHAIDGCHGLLATALLCAALLPLPALTASPTPAVEFHHAAFDHFFVTADAAETALIDRDQATNGWARTGQSFSVDAATGSGLSPVCRFFSTAFAPKSSHFFTADPPECQHVKTLPAWQYEGTAFFSGLPSAAGCGAGRAPLYRLYNDGQGAAPNHRYTTCTSIRDRMLTRGWVIEGVAMCVAARSGDCTVDASPGGTGLADSPFRGSLLLGAPGARSIRLNVLATERSGSGYVEFGTAAGRYDRRTGTITFAANTPVALALDALEPDTRYYYRLHFAPDDGSAPGPTDEYRFHTARNAGQTFTFTVQADSHMDNNTEPAQYRQTLVNVLADAPDFHIDLGDTFMCEKNCTPLTGALKPPATQAEVDARYAWERGNFGLVSASAPIFLVNGNHDGEMGWVRNGTAESLEVWTTSSRQRYFANPVPDGFYTGDANAEPFVGQRAAWYAWQWGDALFVVLDPFWNTAARPNTDGWILTLGARQYEWLRSTLAASTARYKFVFIHNLVGGLDGQMRGGAEAAPYYEWGGRNADGTAGFAQKRPGWNAPVHELLVRYGVTAVFHGHDHLYARQELDGVVYQEVPQPGARNNTSGQSLATEYHYGSGTVASSSGHLRVSVGPDGVAARYVRSWLPGSEQTAQFNREVTDLWRVGVAADARSR